MTYQECILTVGLTPEKAWQKKFIQRLCQTGNVSEACRKAKTTRQNAYVARDTDELFKAAWDEALIVATENLELEARRRAEGFRQPVFYLGKKIGSILQYSDTLMIFLLKAHKPDMYRDNSHVEHGGTVEIKNVTELTDEQLARIAAISSGGTTKT